MAMRQELFFSCLAVFFIFLDVSSASTSISDVVFESFISTGRNLLQAKRACPVNFEFRNYTIITSQCKGPKYPAESCCSAFKKFACPYVNQLNDLTTDCATTMFSYINLYGRYPPGLFASECRQGKEGLACPPASASASASSPSESENVNGKCGEGKEGLACPPALPPSELENVNRKCGEGKEGLACRPALPPSGSENANGECGEGKGVACPPALRPSGSENNIVHGGQLICNPSMLLMAIAGFLLLLFMS